MEAFLCQNLELEERLSQALNIVSNKYWGLVLFSKMLEGFLQAKTYNHDRADEASLLSSTSYRSFVRKD